MKLHTYKILFLANCFLSSACVESVENTSRGAITGTVKRHPEFASRYVDPRNIDIWLPASYGQSGVERYPVLYMHDGQNLFDPNTSYAGVDWGIDETLTRLIDESLVREAIVVGIWNTPRRVPEYMPQRPLESPDAAALRSDFVKQFGMPPISDNYLKFIVEELKPFVDSAYQTSPDAGNTFIMGSSMGGLISLYALLEYPNVFAGAGCVSTHWPIGGPAVIEYVKDQLPSAGKHKIYFDFGTQTLDAQYEPFQQRVDEIVQAAGYRSEQDWMTRKFTGHEHSEKSWKQRVHIPLTFFLGESAIP